MKQINTIFVIDDDAAVRDALTLLLETDGFTVEAFDNAQSFLSACPLSPSGCAIVDIAMPGMDGLQLQEVLKQRGIPLPLIFLTGHGDIQQSVRAIKAGAVDFLTKPVTGAALRKSIKEALKESALLNDQIAAMQTTATRMASLTERELEVMLLVVTGFTNKEIAKQLGISHRTVEIHKARVMHKTGADNVLDLSRLLEIGKTGAPEQDKS